MGNGGPGDVGGGLRSSDGDGFGFPKSTLSIHLHPRCSGNWPSVVQGEWGVLDSEKSGFFFAAKKATPPPHTPPAMADLASPASAKSDGAPLNATLSYAHGLRCIAVLEKAIERLQLLSLLNYGQASPGLPVVPTAHPVKDTFAGPKRPPPPTCTGAHWGAIFPKDSNH